jgi:hypothetical protein
MQRFSFGVFKGGAQEVKVTLENVKVEVLK